MAAGFVGAGTSLVGRRPAVRVDRSVSSFRGVAVARSKRSLPVDVGQRQTVKCGLLNGLVQTGSAMAGLGVLAVTILVHEAGHYFAARSKGIRVQNFSVGFGPKVLSYKPKNSETEFTLRAIPLGGFVAFPNPHDPERTEANYIDPNDPNLLQNRPIGDRALVLSAGVIANVILAWSSLFVSSTSFGVPSINFHEGVLVTKLVDETGNAARAGMRAGDVILKVDGKEVRPAASAASDVAGAIRNSNGRTMMMEVQRGNDILNMKVSILGVYWHDLTTSNLWM